MVQIKSKSGLNASKFPMPFGVGGWGLYNRKHQKQILFGSMEIKMIFRYAFAESNTNPAWF